jgi:OTU domain-containing protein 6
MEKSLQQLQSRHRKEQRDLQSRITQKKKNATKKTRKGVNDECAELERQLKERQEDEIRQLSDPNSHVSSKEGSQDPDKLAKSEPEHKPDPSTNDDLSAKLEATTLSPQPEQTPTPPQSINGGGGPGKKRNRQKERLARRAAEAEAASATAASEASTMTDHRSAEKARMRPVFAAHNLVETEVAPDGHCLFAAFADGLQSNGIEPSSSALIVKTAGEKAKVQPYKVVRRVAAGYMASHGDEFAGFLEEPLEEYVGKIRDTAEWGGQLELTALANAYGVEVKVVQDGRTEVIAPADGEKERKTVWLAYYRHGYGLGEHYNSLRSGETKS